MPNVTFYNGFKKAINSTKRPTGGSSTDVKLKGGCSIIQPVFKLSRNNENINYVKWNDNYYYVDDITHLLNNEIEVSCTRDPLATFKNDIGSSKQFVARSASAYNGLVCDDKYPTYNIANTQTLLLDQLNNQINMSGTVVIGIINNTNNRSVSYYAFSPSDDEFKAILTYMFTGAYLDSSTLAITKEIQKELLNPIQYVVSAMWFPIAKSSISTFSDLNVKFGWWETFLSADSIPEGSRIYDGFGEAFNLPRHPQATTNGLYMNGSPYTKYDLHCWGFGTLPIDTLPFVNNPRCHVEVRVDLFTGIAELTIRDDRGANLVTQSTQFGIPFQLSQITQNLFHAGFTTIASATSAVTSFMAGNVVGGALGVANGISSGIQNCMPQIRSIGSTGSKVQFDIQPQVTCQYYYQVPHDDVTMGRPLMDIRTISSLNGYIECLNVDLVTAATPAEKNEIINYMQNGFFYE